MDIVQFLIAVINLLLALVVLFGGRLIFGKLTELREDVEKLKRHFPEKAVPDSDDAAASMDWKE